MAINKIGEGTTVEIEFMDSNCSAVVGGTYTALGGVKEGTPPGRVRENVVTTDLNDTTPTSTAGGEETVEFTFTMAYDQGSSDHDQLVLLFDNQCDANWQFQNSNWTDTKRRVAGHVVNMQPQGVTRQGLMLEEITVATTGAVSQVS